LNKVMAGKCSLHGVLNADPRPVLVKACPRMLGIALPGFGGARCLRIVANPMIEIILLLELE
jgi:hypothetical protein